MKKNEHQLSELLKAFSKSKPVKKKLDQHRIEEAWQKRMGKTVASYTTNVRFSKGTLFVSVKSAPLRQELHQEKEKIIDLLNEEVGEGIIEKISFR